MKSHRYRSVVFGLCVLFAGIDPAAGVDETSGRGRHSKDGALFSASRYRTNVEYLASDALEGRGTGQEGIDKAARFIAERFERMGVQPAGDDGSYFQDFTLRIKRRIGMGTRLAVEAGDSTHRGKLHGDFVPLPPSGKGTFSGDVVFAGYGIVTDDYNDYEGLDVADKVVLVLRRTPAFGEFGISDAVFSGKGRRASDRDAAAVLVVNRPDDGDALFDYESARRGRSAGVPMVQISRALADEMLASADMPDVAALEKKIEKRQKPISQVLKGVSVRGRVAIRRVKTPARNIVGVIPGTGPQKDEYIVVGGHYDHLGIRNKGKAGFDPAKDISNGADDNASGTTGVLTIANAFSQGAKPNRSILVMLFTGEELGLLGSQHFAKHPTIPLDKCAAMINMDMIGRLKNDKLEVGGMRTGEGLEEIVHRHAETYGFKIRDGGGGRGPSDHTNFYNKKIPVLFFFTGLHKQYHRPEDDSPLLNIEGAIRVTKLVADCIDDIDARPERPAFAADTRRMELAWQREGKEPKEDTPVAAAPNAGQRVRLGIMPVPDEDESGIAIGRVLDDSPADRAGMREGDRIVKIGDTTIGAIGDVIAALGGFNRGDSTTVVVQRGGKNVSLDVRFEAAGKPAAPRATAEMRANGKTIAALIDAVMSIHAIRAGA
ncbi:MAG: M28 family peptidase, partial [Phycisphaerae bacterium]